MTISMVDAEGNDWASIIRSYVMTSKDPLTLKEIEDGVTNQVDGNIPYRAFHYHSLEAMLRDIPGLQVSISNGETAFKVKPTMKTKHIADMVGKSKNSGPRKKKQRTVFNRFSDGRITNVPNQSSIQNRFNVPNNNYSSSFSTEPQRRPTSSPRAHSTPVLSNSSGATIEHPCSALVSHTEKWGLPLPSYTNFTDANKNFYSAVLIKDKKYGSYPQEAKTKEEADKLAAQKALTALRQNTTPQTTTKDESLILERVLNIINDSPNGIFESGIEEIYVRNHDEGLPKNWLQMINHAVTVDVGANNLPILSPLTRTVNTNRSTSSYAHFPPLNQEPEVLKLNNMNKFWLHVYVVYGTKDVWGIVIDEDHSDKITELAYEMKTWYDVHNSPVPTIVEGKYYAILDSECYHRVRCIKIDPESQQAIVFFIDRGDEDVFPATCLRTLQPQFCLLPAQSVRLSMTGLEVFEHCEETRALLEEMLIDKNVLVKNMKFKPMYKEERYQHPVSAQLYFEEVNVNDKLKHEIMRILDPNSKIRTDKTMQRVFISHASDKAIFVQLKSTGLELLNDLIDKLSIDYLSKSDLKLTSVSRFDSTKIYVTENAEDRKWYRVMYKTSREENKAEDEFICIDVGSTIKVNREKLVLLEDLSDLLTLYPKQAVQIQLHKISPNSFDKKMAEHLRKLASKSDLFYLKVVGNLEDVPIVEFYKRTEDNYLASLNDTLALEPEIQFKDDEYNHYQKPYIKER